MYIVAVEKHIRDMKAYILREVEIKRNNPSTNQSKRFHYSKNVGFTNTRKLKIVSREAIIHLDGFVKSKNKLLSVVQHRMYFFGRCMYTIRILYWTTGANVRPQLILTKRP